MNQDMWILHTVTRIHLWLLIVPTGRMRARGVQVEVLKKEKDSDKVPFGAIFGLYAADDIVSSKGKSTPCERHSDRTEDHR